MHKTKLIMHGHWIYEHDSGWKLAVYPIATKTAIRGDHPVIIAREFAMRDLGTSCDMIEKIFASPKDSIRTLVMYNLGSFDEPDIAETLDLYLVCSTANIKDGITHPVITQEGYMYVEDLGIGDNPEEDEPLDSAIHDALLRLEAPHQFTCE